MHIKWGLPGGGLSFRCYPRSTPPWPPWGKGHKFRGSERDRVIGSESERGWMATLRSTEGGSIDLPCKGGVTRQLRPSPPGHGRSGIGDTEARRAFGSVSWCRPGALPKPELWVRVRVRVRVMVRAPGPAGSEVAPSSSGASWSRPGDRPGSPACGHRRPTSQSLGSLRHVRVCMCVCFCAYVCGHRPHAAPLDSPSIVSEMPESLELPSNRVAPIAFRI